MYYFSIDSLGRLGWEEILVGGGEKINWSFIQEGLCDKIFITQSASADATNDSPSLFEASKYAKNIPITFKLKEVKKLDDDALLVKYLTEYK